MEIALIQIQTPKTGRDRPPGFGNFAIVFWIMIWLGHFIFSKFNPQNMDNFHRKKFSILWFWSLGENLISGDFVAEARIALLNHYEGVGMGKFVHHYHNQESTYINTFTSIKMIYLHQNNDCTEQLLFGFERRGREKARSDQQPVSMELPSAGNRWNQVHHYQN